MNRTKTCRWCEWYRMSPLGGICYYEPAMLCLNGRVKACGKFQWNEEEMLKESEKAVKDAMDFSSKGKG